MLYTAVTINAYSTKLVQDGINTGVFALTFLKYKSIVFK